MTNEEAIEVLNKINPFNDNSKMQEYFESVELAINSIQENTKLKAEIERLKELTRFQQEFSVDNKTIGQLSNGEYIDFIKSILWRNYEGTKETERLKSELEKAVKLPCRFSDALFGYCSAFGQILEYELNSVITDEIETIYCISAWSRAIGEYPTECLDELEIQYSDFGKTIFLTREEAEQALKGEVSND